MFHARGAAAFDEHDVPLAGDFAQLVLPPLRHFAQEPPFTGNESARYILIDLLLLQGMGAVHTYIFNGPSWSISEKVDLLAWSRSSM